MTLHLEAATLPGDWSVVTGEGAYLLVDLPEDDELVARCRAAAGTGLDDLLDALVSRGVRQAPAFAAVEVGEAVRATARGAASVHVVLADGTERSVSGERSRTWSETEVLEPVRRIALLVGPDRTASDGAEAGLATGSPEGLPGTAGALVLSVTPDVITLSGFRGTGQGVEASPSTPQPTRRDHVGGVGDLGGLREWDLPGPAADAPAVDAPSAGEVEEPEVPSYDFLFGATQRDRVPAHLLDLDTADDEQPVAARVDAGPVEPVPAEPSRTVATEQPRERPSDLTLPPPAEATAAPPAAQPAAPPGAPPSRPALRPAPPTPPAPSTSGPRPLIDAVPWSTSRAADPDEDAAPPQPPRTLPRVTSAPVPPAPPVPLTAAVPPAPAPAPASPPAPERAPEPAAVVPAAPPATPPTQEEPDEPDEDTVDRSALAAAAPPSAGPTVLAVLCPAGHPSPPHAGHCRVCRREVPVQQPYPTPRPVLGVLTLSTGDVVSLDRGVVLGRAPRPADDLPARDRPHVVKVASPGKDISRNHAEVSLEGWHVLVHDLGSTNGTTVALPGQEPVRLRPGDQQVIEPGTVVTLADEVSFTYEVGP